MPYRNVASSGRTSAGTVEGGLSPSRGPREHAGANTRKATLIKHGGSSTALMAIWLDPPKISRTRRAAPALRSLRDGSDVGVVRKIDPLVALSRHPAKIPKVRPAPPPQELGPSRSSGGTLWSPVTGRG